MSIFRDPLVRELILGGYDRDNQLSPYDRQLRPACWTHRSLPLRVHRVVGGDWEPAVPSFDHALDELQSVMNNVNHVIGHYQNSLAKDLTVGGMRTNRTEDGNFQVAIDVSQYKPEEVNVKLCDDNLIVEAKTETSESDSYHKAEFKRWIKLPNDVKHDGIKSTLTPDKRLVIEVPMNKPIADNRSRTIPIDVQKEPIEGKKQQNGPQQDGTANQQTEAKK